MSYEYRNDSNLIVISNGEIGYYVSHKGVGNIIFELDLGIFTGVKPNVKTIFDKVWINQTNKQEKVLSSEDAVYGYLLINYDTKTIVSASGYSIPNVFLPQWILQSLKNIFEDNYNRKDKEIEEDEDDFADDELDENVISLKSLEYHFKNKNVKIQNQIKEVFDLDYTMEDLYKDTRNYIYKFYQVKKNNEKLKNCDFFYIQTPKDWTLINKDKGDYDEELKNLIEEQLRLSSEN
jgi:hypothetical protein